MKELLKKRAGAVIVVIILVVVLAVVGGGAAFLAVRMVVSGDGNFLQPFEELGWIESKDEDSKSKDKSKKDEDKDVEDEDEEDEDEDDSKTSTKSTKTSGNKGDYLVEESRLSAESKKSGVDHYYGKMPLGETMGEDEEFGDLYDLLKAGVNLYAKDGKTIEIEFGFDVTEFCQEAFNKFGDEFKEMGMNSAEDLQDMMMEMIEEEFDSSDEYSTYMTKYVEGGSLQLYVTEEGFASLYETYGIEEGEDDIDVLIDSLEEAFDMEINLVED